jgi:hypothetical protein
VSDMHHLPLLGRDLPVYERPEPLRRARVFSLRLVTGHLVWYWSRPVEVGTAVCGPFLTPGDAHDDIERATTPNADLKLPQGV